jgi:ubiquinone/menaquinone biosynthesis C-methylase UbiE
LNKAKASFFDSQADHEWADAEYSPEEMAKIQRLISNTGIKRGSSILEPGCGTGRLTKILSALIGTEGCLISCDISPNMIAKCRKRLESKKNTKIFLGPIENLPCQQKSMDIVLCHQVFPHFDDKPFAVKLLTKILQPNGKFIIFHFKNSVWINDLHRKTHPAIIADLIPSPDEMHRMFQTVGMQVDVLEDDYWGYFLNASFTKGGGTK